MVTPHKALQEKMLKLQREYTRAVRAGILSEKELRKLADKGFKAEKAVLESLKKLK